MLKYHLFVLLNTIFKHLVSLKIEYLTLHFGDKKIKKVGIGRSSINRILRRKQLMHLFYLERVQELISTDQPPREMMRRYQQNQIFCTSITGLLRLEPKNFDKTEQHGKTEIILTGHPAAWIRHQRPSSFEDILNAKFISTTQSLLKN